MRPPMSRWTALLVVLALLCVACGAGGTTVVTGTTLQPSVTPLNGLLIVATQDGLAAYPDPDADNTPRWRWHWPGPPTCPACFFTIDQQSIFAVAGTQLTRLDATGQALATVALAGQALAAPLVMHGMVFVLTPKGIQWASESAPLSAQGPTTPPPPPPDTKLGYSFTLTGERLFVTAGDEVQEIDCNGQPVKPQLTGTVQLRGAALDRPVFSTSHMYVLTSAGIEAYPLTTTGIDAKAGQIFAYPFNPLTHGALALGGDGMLYAVSDGLIVHYDPAGKPLSFAKFPSALLSRAVTSGQYVYIATADGVLRYGDGDPIDPSNGATPWWKHPIPPAPGPGPDPALLAAATADRVLYIAMSSGEVAGLRLPVIPPTHTLNLMLTSPALSMSFLELGG